MVFQPNGLPLAAESTCVDTSVPHRLTWVLTEDIGDSDFPIATSDDLEWLKVLAERSRGRAMSGEWRRSDGFVLGEIGGWWRDGYHIRPAMTKP